MNILAEMGRWIYNPYWPGGQNRSPGAIGTFSITARKDHG